MPESEKTMTIYVNSDEIKHVDIPEFAQRMRKLGNRLHSLAGILERDSVLDITMLDNEFFDILCGDATDEMYVIGGTFNDLIVPYKQALLDEFLQENMQNGQ
jgi:hypothetical protein